MFKTPLPSLAINLTNVGLFYSLVYFLLLSCHILVNSYMRWANFSLSMMKHGFGIPIQYIFFVLEFMTDFSVGFFINFRPSLSLSKGKVKLSFIFYLVACYGSMPSDLLSFFYLSMYLLPINGH